MLAVSGNWHLVTVAGDGVHSSLLPSAEVEPCVVSPFLKPAVCKLFHFSLLKTYTLFLCFTQLLLTY